MKIFTHLNLQNLRKLKNMMISIWFRKKTHNILKLQDIICIHMKTCTGQVKIKKIYIQSTESSLFSGNILSKTTKNMKIFIHLRMKTNISSENQTKVL